MYESYPMRDATLDVVGKNIESLITDLKSLRDKWDQLWKEATSVASSLDVESNYIDDE